MNSTQSLVNRLRDQTSTRSDYAVAKLLGISQSRMSNYMRGARNLDDDEIITRAAELVGDDPAAVLAEFQAEKCKEEKARAAWRRIAAVSRALSHKGISAAAVALAMGLSATMSPSPAAANALASRSGGNVDGPSTVYYVKL